MTKNMAASAKKLRMYSQAERQRQPLARERAVSAAPHLVKFSQDQVMEKIITWDDVPALMEELRAMARALLALENNAQSISPTALVNTALRRQKPGGWKVSFDDVRVTWRNRKYFFGAMYRSMLQALVDRARKRLRKGYVRPVQVEQLHLENLVQTANDRPEQLIALRMSLERLRAKHSEWAELVEHHLIAGYTFEEIGRIMGVSERTARRRWQKDWEYIRGLVCDEIICILNNEDISLEDLDG